MIPYLDEPMSIGEKMKNSILFNVLSKEGKNVTVVRSTTLESDFCPCCGTDHGKPILTAKQEDGREVWKCARCQRSGDTAEFIVALKGISLSEALKQVNEEYGARIHFNKKNDPERQRAIETVIDIFLEKLPSIQDECLNHLVKCGLSASVIRKAATRNVFRFLPGGTDWKENQKWLEENVGLDLMIKAGMQKPDKQFSGLAFRPILFFFPKRKAFEAYNPAPKEGMPKFLRYGHTAAPYWWSNGLRSRQQDVWLVNGPIEMLILIQTHPHVSVIGLPGETNGWRPDWIGSLKKIGDRVKLVCALKNNDAGNTASKKLETFCNGADILFERNQPLPGM